MVLIAVFYSSLGAYGEKRPVSILSKVNFLQLLGIPYDFTGLYFVFLIPNSGWNYVVRLH